MAVVGEIGMEPVDEFQPPAYLAKEAGRPERAQSRPEGSYVARLLEGGVATCAQKLGEEGVEAALATVTESDERLVAELADLWFASYVVLAARGLDPAAVEDELARRAAEADARPT